MTATLCLLAAIHAGSALAAVAVWVSPAPIRHRAIKTACCLGLAVCAAAVWIALTADRAAADRGRQTEVLRHIGRR